MEIVLNILGWIGAICTLTAYYWVSTNQISSTSFIFQMLNILGGLLIFLNSAYYGAIPSAILNLLWASIALFSVSKIYQNKATRKKEH